MKASRETNSTGRLAMPFRPLLSQLHPTRRNYIVAVLAHHLLLICTAPNATAQMNAWHTAAPITSNSFVDSNASPPNGVFGPLNLRCDGSAGPCSWLITTSLRIVNGTAVRYDLWLRDAAGPATNLSISQTSISGSPFSTPLFLAENSPGGFLSRIHAESPTQIHANENVGHFMHSFVLTQTAVQTNGIQNIIAASYYGFEGTGPLTDPGYGTRFASVDNTQAIRHVFLYQEWNDPVIRITNTPEPATAAMLLAPAVLLLRRRRSRDRSHRRGKKSE